MLHDVNLSVPQGSIYGLIGPNGAGKTTVFNLITGLLPPSGGAITLNGDSLLRRAPHQITRMGIARTFQNIRLFKEMTLLENVVVGAYRHMNYGFQPAAGLPGFREHEKRARERAHELLTWMRLDHKAMTWPTTCPTANSAGWSWRARWPPSPSCCCWTSRSRA